MKQYIITTEVTETTEPKGNEITNTINSNSPLGDSQWVQWLNPFVI